MSVIETRERLLETALELIWQSNYSSVGVNEICKQAGVTKGAFYHHFESKSSLFCEATSYYWQVIKKDLDNIFSAVNTPLEQLENLIQFLFTSKLSEDNNSVRGCPFFNVGAQIGTDDQKVIEALQALSQTAIKYNLALVKALNAEGYLYPVTDMEQQARLMYHFIHGVMSYAHVHPDVSTIKKDLPEGLYRLLGVKQEFWFSTSPTWQAEPPIIKNRA
ncbi:TetR/AcrR family transcriptional regulator [Methylophaga sp. OBS4]|uniref:TetR/AcrR family transcriptional regulator n=1 Tax=Methylophaga sp. OBS4 TaxID=2991935 RepID=UPI00225A2354|nr:TetR/AcrR family transcriptional regulator [Methylophaga sp. OBS4]MCX4186633.1 TetR/AcrR family transcriptional regulator [Methylophaga sp. OBS4]